MSALEYRRVWLKWAAVQFASIFCLVAVCMLIFAGISRSGDPETPLWLAVGIVAQCALFYMLHLRLQRVCADLDPLRSDRIVALIKMRASRLDPEW